MGGIDAGGEIPKAVNLAGVIGMHCRHAGVAQFLAIFDAVIEQGKDLPMTAPMQDSVMNSDMGPAVMYHLCRFPEECDRIAALPPMVAIREMGKLEARIEAAQTGPVSSAASVTQAPRPIKPVGGGATASTVPLDQMDYQSYRHARMKGFGR